MGDTGISYADKSWDILAGCNPVSGGCENCWAARLAGGRLQHHPDYAGLTRKTEDGRLQWTGEVRLLPHRLEEPLHWRAPQVVFVASRGDLFHETVPDEYIDRVFRVMLLARQHTFLLLTKRPERMLEYCQGLVKDFAAWPLPTSKGMSRIHLISLARSISAIPLPNVILGVTAEDREHLSRLDILRQTPAAHRWVSAEPLLQDLGELNLDGISWIVVGGESGKNARPMRSVWASDIGHQCSAAGVPFYFKQAKEGTKMVHLPMLDGFTWEQTPWSQP